MVEFWIGESAGTHGKRVMPSATQTAAENGRSHSFSRFRSNPFWRNTRLEKHENDPLNTDPPAVPATAVPPRDITCGACGCKIARSGEILKTGETYKQFLKHEQTIEAKDREIAALTAKVAELTAENTALKSSGGDRASGHRPGGRIQ